MEVDTDCSVSVPMQFVLLTRELEVKLCKGLPSTEAFKFLFNCLSEEAPSMPGRKQTTKETPRPPSPFDFNGNQFCEKKSWT